jgi:DNA-binding transcriptional ArsR family regulator
MAPPFKISILCFLMVSILIVGGLTFNARAENETKSFDPESIGIEVLLNQPGITLDRMVVDELIEKGKITKADHSTTVVTLERSGPGNDRSTYLMRSESNPDLGLAIREEDFTTFLKSSGYEIPMNGVSITIFSPGEIELEMKDITRFSQQIQTDIRLDESIVQDIHAMGIGEIKYSNSSQSREIILINEGYSINIFQFPVENNSTDWRIAFNVEVEMISPEMERSITDLVQLFNSTYNFWEDARQIESSIAERKILTDGDFDPFSLDWSVIMKEELERLVEIGLLRGLREAEIDPISNQCGVGVIGFEKRIFFDNATMEWVPYNSTFYPLPFMGNGNSITVFPSSDIPEKPGIQERSDDNLIIWIAGSILSAILLISFIYFFHRISKNVIISNERRKIIYELIGEEPGIHFSEIMKRMDLKPGVTSYHINRLEKDELIKSHQDGMYRRFYLFDEKVEMKLRLSDLQKMILETVKDEPGISQIEISRILGRSRVIIHYHVGFLKELGVIFLEKEGRETRCFLTEHGISISGQ